jgi:hypothetical protein
MASKDYLTPEAQANQQSQVQPAMEYSQLLTTLTEAVKKLTEAVTDQKTALTAAVDKVTQAVAPTAAPDPFEHPDAKKAVETFSDIVEDLKLKPLLPDLKTVTAVSAAEIKLEWNWTDDVAIKANGFKIERRDDITSTFTEIAPGVAAGDRSYTDKGLVSKNTYYYRLRASTNRGDSPYTTELGATTT